jgi:hypothetical protein
MFGLPPPRHISEDVAVQGVFGQCLAILTALGYGFRRSVKLRSRKAVRQRRRAWCATLDWRCKSSAEQVGSNRKPKATARSWGVARQSGLAP